MRHTPTATPGQRAEADKAEIWAIVEEAVRKIPSSARDDIRGALLIVALLEEARVAS